MLTTELGNEDVQHSVGTGGGVEWMWGPCACPRGYTIASQNSKELCGDEGQAQGPHPSLHPPPCPYRTVQKLPVITPFGCQTSLGLVSTLVIRDSCDLRTAIAPHSAGGCADQSAHRCCCLEDGSKRDWRCPCHF